MVSDVTLTGAAQSAQKTQAQGVKLANDFSDFLTLLTTQLKNQDPLSPMDSTEFTNQLVQFSQVEQSINTNQKLDSLLSLQMNGQSNIALGYVGMDVTYTSAEMNFDGSRPININYGLDKNASVLKVNIYNESGQLVRSLDGPKTTGAQSISWDGKDLNGNTVPVGTYSVKIDAADGQGAPLTVATAVSGNVRGIEAQNGVVFLLVGDRAVALSSVLQATNPPAAETTAPEGEA
ncbi:MAG TPA: flagellar hook assembly protein FlgD [Alphaproteobacteria bacterium]